MKLLIWIAVMTLFTAACLHAGFLSFPDLTTDGLAVDPASPAWGVPVVALSGTTYFIGFNDNWGNNYPGQTFSGSCQPISHSCDLDGNDAVLTATFDSTGTSYVLRYLLSISTDINYVVPLGSADYLAVGQTGTYPSTPGGEVIVWNIDKTTGKSYFTGDKSRNEDNVLQRAYVTTIQPIPEPGTWGLLGVGLVGVFGWRRIKGLV